MQGGAQRGGIRHGKDEQRVRGQQVFGGRNGGVERTGQSQRRGNYGEEQRAEVFCHNGLKFNGDKRLCGAGELFFVRLVFRPARRFQVTIRIVRIVGSVGEG